MIEFTTSNLITLLSLFWGMIAGWALREFAVINKQHDNLSKNVDKYMNDNNKNVTGIQVDIGKIQTSMNNIEEALNEMRK